MKKDFDTLMQKYIDNNRLYSFDGERGVRNFKQVVTEVCGYEDNWGGVLENFLADNPGAVQAMMEWISSQQSPEWKENLEQMVEENALDEADDAEDERNFVVRGF